MVDVDENVAEEEHEEQEDDSVMRVLFVEVFLCPSQLLLSDFFGSLLSPLWASAVVA